MPDRNKKPKDKMISYTLLLPESLMPILEKLEAKTISNGIANIVRRAIIVGLPVAFPNEYKESVDELQEQE